MEGKRNSSDSRDQSKKIKTIGGQIEAPDADIPELPDDAEIPNLPDEIIAEILTRLPVKSLLKFRCVAKSWLSLISSSKFIKSHLKISTENADFSNHGIILTTTFNLKHCSVKSLTSEPVTVATVMDYPNKKRYRPVWVVGSVNGLICIAVDDNDMFLWNPSTRTSKKLPPVAVEMKEGFYHICGLGYCEPDDDYKVVSIFCVYGFAGEYESVVQMYSLKTDSWKMIEGFKGGVLLNDTGKFASGKLHFSAKPGYGYDRRSVLVSLDLKTEVYDTIELPSSGHGRCESSVGLLGGCISVMHDYGATHANVWVLKEYGNKDSWTKVVTIPYVIDPGKYYYSYPLCILPDGKVLLVHGVKLVLYNPKKKSLRNVKTRKTGDFIEADMYVESLVSL